MSLQYHCGCKFLRISQSCFNVSSTHQSLIVKCKATLLLVHHRTAAKVKLRRGTVANDRATKWALKNLPVVFVELFSFYSWLTNIVAPYQNQQSECYSSHKSVWSSCPSSVHLLSPKLSDAMTLLLCKKTSQSKSMNLSYLRNLVMVHFVYCIKYPHKPDENIHLHVKHWKWIEQCLDSVQGHECNIRH